MSIIETSMVIGFIALFFYIGYIAGKSKRIVKEFDDACDEIAANQWEENGVIYGSVGTNIYSGYKHENIIHNPDERTNFEKVEKGKREERIEAITFYHKLSRNSMPNQRVIRSINMIEAQRIGNEVEKDWLRFGGNSVEWEIVGIEREAMNPLCNVIFKFK